MLGSEQVKNLVLAMGAAIGDTFDIGKVRYHKMIIATDADVDGAHIRTLLLTFFYRYYKPVIEAGYVYIAQPPLYKISYNKDVRYAYSDEEKVRVLREMGFGDIAESAEEVQGEGEEVTEEDEEVVVKKSGKKPSIQRYKGLGEMNPEELKETTMDVNNRTLKVVSVHDAEEANKVFEMLMGNEVGPRKSFIQTYAKQANLDI
jgi:DNA gyrase subunit B